MILVDTSVWIAHLRHRDAKLVSALETGQVLVHPFVVGELACGNLKPRSEVLGLLQNLPNAITATTAEVLDFVEGRQLMGRGIGYVDVHLLAACVLTDSCKLWTLDVRLANVAHELSVAYSPPAIS